MKIDWFTKDGITYGTIEGTALTFRVTCGKGWPESCQVFDADQPSRGWVHLVYVQRFDADKPLYFPPFGEGGWKNGEKNEPNVAGAEALIKAHVQLLFEKRAA